MPGVLAASLVITDESDSSVEQVRGAKRRRVGVAKRRPSRVLSSDSEGDVIVGPAQSAAIEARRETDRKESEKVLQELVRMGFAGEKACNALLRVGRLDVSAATELLLSEAGQLSPASSPQRDRQVPVAVVDPGPLPEPQPAEVVVAPAAPAQKVSRPPTPLAAFSAKAKDAVVTALSGPGGKRWRKVHDSIRRGRIALSANLWDGNEDEQRLEQFSPAYVQLKPYQRTGVRWLLSLARAGMGGILADEMGLGKTAQMYTFLDLLPKVASVPIRAKPSLIIVPPSLIDTWETEAQKWCPQLIVFRYHASVLKERRALAETFFDEYHNSCDIILSTAQVLHSKEDRAFFFRRMEFEYLIIDEAHDMKNAASARCKDIRGLRVHRRILMSGTPVQNSLQQLGNLLSIVIAPPMGVEEGCRKTAKATAAAANELLEVVERGALRTLQVRSAPLILRRRKRDVMSELPSKTGHTVQCAMLDDQRRLYNAEMELARSKASARIKGGATAFVSSLFHRLRRVCNHPLLLQTRLRQSDYELLVDLLLPKRPDFRRASREKALNEVRGWSDFDVAMAVQDYGLAQHIESDETRSRFVLTGDDLCKGAAKVDQLLKILQKQRVEGGKTLVFSQFTQYLDVIALALQHAGYGYVRLDGGVKVEERAAIVKRFSSKDSRTDVFLLSTKAGGTGLNLVAANAVVLMDMSFNPQDNRQAEDRAHRIGQTQPVSVYYLVGTGTIEEALLHANLKKLELDYQFGGERSLLKDKRSRKKASSCVKSVGDETGADENSRLDDVLVEEQEVQGGADSDTDDSDAEGLGDKKVEKDIEQMVMSELESVLRG